MLWPSGQRQRLAAGAGPHGEQVAPPGLGGHTRRSQPHWPLAKRTHGPGPPVCTPSGHCHEGYAGAGPHADLSQSGAFAAGGDSGACGGPACGGNAGEGVPGCPGEAPGPVVCGCAVWGDANCVWAAAANSSSVNTRARGSPLPPHALPLAASQLATNSETNASRRLIAVRPMSRSVPHSVEVTGRRSDTSLGCQNGPLQTHSQLHRRML